MFTPMPTLAVFSVLLHSYEKNEAELDAIFKGFIMSGSEKEGAQLVDFTSPLESSENPALEKLEKIGDKLKTLFVPFDRKIMQGEVLLHEICCRISFKGVLKQYEFKGNNRTAVRLDELIEIGLSSSEELLKSLSMLSDERSVMTWRNQYAQQTERAGGKYEQIKRNVEPGDKTVLCVIENPGSDEKTACEITITKHGIAIGLEGYSDNLSDDDNGTPIYITYGESGIAALVYGDINQEDPSSTIDLSGAKLENRE